MLHFRVVVPHQRCEDLVDELRADPAVTNLVVLYGNAVEPPGDLILCDVAREAASRWLDRLEELRIDEVGSVSIQAIESMFSRSAQRAEEATPGFAVDAVVWQEIDQYAREESSLSFAFVAFLAIATQIAAIGVITDSPILIVGAMVLGPEFSAVASISIGLYRRKARRAAAGLRTLVVGFLAAIAVTCLCALISRALALIDESSLGHQVQTGFIVHPNTWSFIVAVLAGSAGILSLTTARSMTLVGVFISVTTVPAAGNAAVAIALGKWSELAGSLEQLGLNIGGMVVAGTLTLVLLRAGWSLVPEPRRRRVARRLGRRWPRVG